MSQSSIFPVYIKTQYDGSGGAFDQLTREARNSVDESKRIFDSGYSQIQGIVSKALSVPRNNLGSLDLGVDEYRRAAQEADALAIASREVANAMQVQTRAAASVSKEDQLVAASARAAATAAETQANEYRALARAAELTQEALNRQKSATDAVVASTTRGTDAWGIHAQSMRGSRQAMVQTGQQMQDLAISIYGGQRASVVFAQQIPQLAFALTSLEGSSNKTADKIGRFATLLSGPWSIAVVAASALLGGLIDHFFLAGDEADKTAKKSIELADAFDKVAFGTKGATDAIKDYNDQQDRARKGTDSMIKLNLASAEARLKDANATREQLAAELDKQLTEAKRAINPALGGFSNTVQSGQALAIQAQIRANADSIAATEAAVRNLRILDAGRDAKAAVDPIAAINNKYDDMAEAAKRAAAGNNALSLSLKGTLTQIEKQRTAAVDAQKEVRKASETAPKLADVTGKEVARLLGAPITSGTRTAAQNKAAGGAANSYHLTGQAIDIPISIGGKPLTKEGIRAALAPAGVIIKELLGPGDKNHSDHFHIAFSRKRGAPDQIEKQAEAAKKALDSLIQTGENAGRTIAGINARWNEQPRLVDQVKKDVADLDALITDLRKNNAGGVFDGQIADAQAARALALDAPNKLMRDMVEANAENAAIDSLRLQNLTVEAEVLTRTLALAKTKGDVTQKDAEAIAQIVMDENRRAILLEKQNEAQQRSLQTLEATQSNLRTGIRDLLGGKGFSAIGDIFKRQWGIYLDSLADQFAEQLFGESFRQEKLKILGLDKVDEAGQAMGVKVTQVVDELERLRLGLAGAAGAVGAANDNGDGSLEASFDKTFVSTGNASQSILAAIRSGPLGAAQLIADSVGTGVLSASKTANLDLRKTLSGVLKKALGEELYGSLGKLFQGAALGNAGATTILGQKGNNAGSFIGGAFGEAAFKSVAPSLFKKLGSFAGPLGSIVGGVLGGLIGSIFSKAKTGSASVSNGAVTLGGNNAAAKGTAGKTADAIGSQLNRIAEQLGGTVGNYGFTIGTRKDEYRVSGSSGANVTSKNPGGLLYKGKDAEEAARAALLNAIQDGAITGIRAGAQRLLQAGKDLEGQVQKALSFQSIFDRLKAYEDPMGAALDKLDREFENLRKIAIEAGEGMVELEKLYGIERANVIKEANEKITSSLRGLYDSLTVGNDARSLSERRALAQSKYDPLATRVAAGDTTAYDDFASAAQTLLDIERQIFGSQGGYFSRLDEITSLTKTRIDAESNVASISSDRPGLFTPTVANDNVPVVNAIDAQTGAILAVGNQTNTLLATLLSKWNGTTGMPFSNTAYF